MYSIKNENSQYIARLLSACSMTSSIMLLMTLLGACGSGGGDGASNTSTTNQVSENPSTPIDEPPSDSENLNISPNLYIGDDFDAVEKLEVGIQTEIADDPDGSITAVKWTQIEGPQVEIQRSLTLIPTFIAPEVDQDTDIVLQLEVTDNDRGTSTDTVKITIVNAEANFKIESMGLKNTKLNSYVGYHWSYDNWLNNEAGFPVGSSDQYILNTLPNGPKYFLFEVYGGERSDLDYDGLIDKESIDFNGVLYAVIPRADIGGDSFNVTVLTDIVFSLLLSEIKKTGSPFDYNVSQETLDNYASTLLVSDLNGDLIINYQDILAFSPYRDTSSLAFSFDELYKTYEVNYTQIAMSEARIEAAKYIYNKSKYNHLGDALEVLPGSGLGEVRAIHVGSSTTTTTNLKMGDQEITGTTTISSIYGDVNIQYATDTSEHFIKDFTTANDPNERIEVKTNVNGIIIDIPKKIMSRWSSSNPSVSTTWPMQLNTRVIDDDPKIAFEWSLWDNGSLKIVGHDNSIAEEALLSRNYFTKFEADPIELSFYVLYDKHYGILDEGSNRKLKVDIEVVEKDWPLVYSIFEKTVEFEYNKQGFDQGRGISYLIGNNERDTEKVSWKAVRGTDNSFASNVESVIPFKVEWSRFKENQTLFDKTANLYVRVKVWDVEASKMFGAPSKQIEKHIQIKAKQPKIHLTELTSGEYNNGDGIEIQFEMSGFGGHDEVVSQELMLVASTDLSFSCNAPGGCYKKLAIYPGRKEGKITYNIDYSELKVLLETSSGAIIYSPIRMCLVESSWAYPIDPCIRSNGSVLISINSLKSNLQREGGSSSSSSNSTSSSSSSSSSNSSSGGSEYSQIMVDINSTGLGSISISGGSLNCVRKPESELTGNCSLEIQVGTNVELIATPSAGYKFVEWLELSNNYNACLGQTRFCKFLVKNTTLRPFVAVFEPEVNEHESQFSKINVSGDKLNEQAASWECILDDSTGAMWQNKINRGEYFHYEDSFQSWYVSSEVIPSELNDILYCGRTKWRLPTRSELAGIFNADSSLGLFSFLGSRTYWTRESNEFDTSSAYILRNDDKSETGVSVGVLSKDRETYYLMVSDN